MTNRIEENMCTLQVQQLYHEREAEMEERMKDVSRRARTPSVVAKVGIVEWAPINDIHNIIGEFEPLHHLLLFNYRYRDNLLP